MFLQKLPEIPKRKFTDLSRSRQWCLPNSYSSVPMSTHTSTRPQWFRLRLYSACTVRQLLPSPLEEYMHAKPWHGVLGRELLLTLAPSTRNSYWRFSRTKERVVFFHTMLNYTVGLLQSLHEFKVDQNNERKRSQESSNTKAPSTRRRFAAHKLLGRYKKGLGKT